MLNIKNIPYCATVDFSVFAKNPTASFAEFVGLCKTRRGWRDYLLVRHTDCVQLVHWTRASSLAQIREQGLLPRGDGTSDFGPGIYCFRAQGHDNLFVHSRVADECEANGDTIVPILFTAPEWYECVATSDVTTAFRYCFVKGPVPTAQMAPQRTALPDKFPTVAEELAAMGMSVEYQRGIGVNTTSIYNAAESLSDSIWGPQDI